MTYRLNGAVISVEQINGFGKNPGLWVGSEDQNTLYKVASFGSVDKAQMFCSWFEYFTRISDIKPEVKKDAD